MSEPQEAEVVDGTEVDHLPAVIPAVPALAVTPTVKAAELVERLSVIRQAMDTAMTEDVDYGKVPGTNKPTLLKPGAEKLSVLFQLDVQLANEKVWGPGDHLTVISCATAFHAPTGSRLGYGEGVCSTRERKYAYRRGERVCPVCNKPAIIKGKAEYGGGWVCFKKKDGCGTKFADGDPLIESQQTGDVENPDLPDLWNTVVKMAEKRARVDAVLAVTGASALFTQDAEDIPREPPAAPEKPPQAAQQASSPRVDPDTLEGLRRRFKDTGWTSEQLAMQLTALGAPDVSDVRAAMQALSPEQARQLLSAMNAAADEQIAAEEALQEHREAARA